MKAVFVWAAAFAAAVLGGCGGGGGSSGGGSGTCNPGQTATVTVGASGFSPKAVCVVPTGTVTFHNSDSSSHDIESASATTCTELNLGSIDAGQSKTTTAFPTTQTCSFVDANHSADAAFQGTVAVSNAPTTGPGY
jgi:plastocyanin